MKEEVFALLTDVERRYRSDRLRVGPKALTLPADEEERVLNAAQEACDIYATAPAGDQSTIRAFFRDSYALRPRLLALIARHSRTFAASGSVDALRNALIALIVEDGQTDVRDTFLSLNGFRELAAKFGFNAQSLFDEISAIASTRMQKLLR